MKSSIFREYDIRGIVGKELILDDVYTLGQAIGYFFSQSKHSVKTVVLGYDARIHSMPIKESLESALCSSGFDVIDIGLCHSPAMYFALHTLSVEAGLMVTASHNAKEYNGIKICLGKKPVWGDDIRVIQQLYERGSRVQSDAVGVVKKHNIVADYINFLVEHFTHLVGIPLSCVIDCGNGATGVVMPQLVEKMKWNNVRLLCAEVDGTYPNHEANPVDPENMEHVRRALHDTDAVVGIGLDGDGDRMAAMTKSETLLGGDILLAIFTQSLLKKFTDISVVFDSKMSQGLVDLFDEWGVRGHMVSTGHPYVKEGIATHKALLGGELSCHFMFADRYFGYDDGVYAALRLIELLVESGKTIDELAAIFPGWISSPEMRVLCEESAKDAIVESVADYFSGKMGIQVSRVDGVRIVFDDGWAIVRASNTQSMVSIRFESKTQSGYDHIRSLLVHVLQLYFDDIEAVFSGSKDTK